MDALLWLVACLASAAAGLVAGLLLSLPRRQKVAEMERWKIEALSLRLQIASAQTMF